jgi:hypothetical protein
MEPLSWCPDVIIPAHLAQSELPDADFLLPALLRDALVHGNVVHARSWVGEVTAPAALFEALTKCAYRVVCRRLSSKHKREDVTLVGEGGTVKVDIIDGRAEVGARLRGKEAAAALDAVFETHLKPTEDEQGQIHLLVSTHGQYTFRRTRGIGEPMMAENYTPKVVEGYKHAVAEMGLSSPSGRLVLLIGPAGTGKSFVVRALVHELRKTCSFVLVPPHLLAELSTPAFLPALFAHAEEVDLPIVVVLEDADECLVRRERDNIAALSTLLNLSDGILGAALDLRIVATTNARNLELDPAILRSGRLLEHIAVGPLPAAQCKAVFTRLLPEAREALVSDGSDHSLAWVYAQARQAGWKPPAPPARGGRRRKQHEFGYSVFDEEA